MAPDPSFEIDFPPWEIIFGQPPRRIPLDIDPDFTHAADSVVRGLFVVLDETISQALEARPDDKRHAAVAIHADVLRIPAAVELFTRSCLIHARRIEVGDGATLRLASHSNRSDADAGNAADPASPACRLEINADEWVVAGDPSFPVHLGGVTHEITAAIGGAGFGAEVDAGGSVSCTEEPRLASGDLLAGQVALGAAKRLGSRSTVPVPDGLSIKMADWVRRTSPDAFVARDAAGLITRLRSPEPFRHPIPFTTLADHRPVAAATLDALTAVHSDWIRMMEIELTGDDRKKQAETTLAHYRSTKCLGDKLLQQAVDNADEAMAAVAAAQEVLTERQAALESLQQRFDEGVEAMKAAKQNEAIWGAIVAVGTVAVGVVAVVATAGAATPVAGAATAAAVTAADTTVKTLTALEKLIELLKKLGKVLDQIKEVYEKLMELKSLYDGIADPIALRAKVEASRQTVDDLTYDVEPMTSADWDEFVIELGVAFQPAIDLEVDGAGELQAELKKLAVRGKDLVDKQLLLEQAQQDFDQKIWQQLRDAEDIQTMEHRLADLDDSLLHVDPMMTFHSNLRDRLSARMIGLFQEMADAYRFLTLQEPDVMPAMDATPTDLRSLMAQLEADLVSAQQALGSTATWEDDIDVHGGSPALLSLQTHRSFDVVVSLDTAFRTHDRVRVRDLEVWLEGDFPDSRIHLQIHTNGLYDDRLDGDQFHFIAKPLFWTFEYEPDPNSTRTDHNGNPVRVISASTDADRELDFTAPSVFSSWRIRLPHTGNDIDPATITGVKLRFKGVSTGQLLTMAPATRAAVDRGRSAPQPLRPTDEAESGEPWLFEGVVLR